MRALRSAGPTTPAPHCTFVQYTDGLAASSRVQSVRLGLAPVVHPVTVLDGPVGRVPTHRGSAEARRLGDFLRAHVEPRALIGLDPGGLAELVVPRELPRLVCQE